MDTQILRRRKLLEEGAQDDGGYDGEGAGGAQMDTYNEMNPGSGELEYLANSSRAVFKAMRGGDPQGGPLPCPSLSLHPCSPPRTLSLHCGSICWLADACPLIAPGMHAPSVRAVVTATGRPSCGVEVWVCGTFDC